MLAFIVGNTNFNFDRMGAKNVRGNTFYIIFLENNRLKNVEVEIKEKIEKIKNFNPNSCYDFSDVEDVDESATAGGSIMISASNPSLEDTKRQNTYTNLKTDVIINNSSGVGKKLLKLKYGIKWLDVIASVLIIFGCIIAQVENDNYYYNNREDRVEIIKLITQIDKFKGNLSMVNMSSFNISYLNNETITSKINFTDFNTIPIPFEISSYSYVLRTSISFLTILAIPLIVVGRYAEYMREFVYTQNIVSK
jgi:hypothetical protein